MASAQNLANVVNSFRPSYPPTSLGVVHYLKLPYQMLKRAIFSNGITSGVAATVEPAILETQSVQATIQSRLWLPPDYQRPDNTKRLQLEIDNILNLAKKEFNYDGFRLGYQIMKKVTEKASQIIGFLDPDSGIIRTTDRDLYSAVIGAIELMNRMQLNYRRVGIGLKVDAQLELTKP